MPQGVRKPRRKATTEAQEFAKIDDGARTVCFEHTIDGMKYELELFVAKIREEWSCYTKNIWAHDTGLEVLDQVIEALSRYNDDFRAKYSTHEDGWGPNHPRWESWPHLRQSKMHCPTPQEYESEEFFRLDLYGQRRIKFFMDVVEKLRPFVEAWRHQRRVDDAPEDDISQVNFISTLDVLRDALKALDDVLSEPEGPATPHNDEVYLKLCRTTRKGLAMAPWLPAAAWIATSATRKRPAPANEEEEDSTSHAASLRAEKRLRATGFEVSMPPERGISGTVPKDAEESKGKLSTARKRSEPADGHDDSTTSVGGCKRAKVSGSEAAGPDVCEGDTDDRPTSMHLPDVPEIAQSLPIRPRLTDAWSQTKHLIPPNNPQAKKLTDVAALPQKSSSVNVISLLPSDDANDSENTATNDGMLAAVTTPGVLPCSDSDEADRFDMFEKFRLWTALQAPTLTQPGTSYHDGTL